MKASQILGYEMSTKNKYNLGSIEYGENRIFLIKIPAENIR